ncbi:MAG TPA: hypothetical protein GXX63_09400 [Tissierellia bacterium]|nr:hypothetical protein [Tissierellia bacterium]
MAIKGISDYRRLPRLGKIKLGKRNMENKGIPYQTEYFVCPEEVQAVYGPEPTELDIMFPANDMEIIFPQYYKKYGKTGLKCKGDGQNATCMVKGELIEKDCTPNSPECSGCKPIGTLNFTLPKIAGFGAWQIWTSSWNSIVNLNSSIDMIKVMTGGKIAFIPLKLILQEHNAVIQSDKGQFQKKVYVMSLNIDSTMGEFYNQHSFEAQLQRGIDTNEGFAVLNDTANKMKMLNESKQKEQNIREQNDEEFEEFEEKTIPVGIEGIHYVVDREDKLICSECGTDITLAQKKLSEFKFNKILCAKCQAKEDYEIPF